MCRELDGLPVLCALPIDPQVVRCEAWFRMYLLQVTPEIERALMTRDFLVLNRVQFETHGRGPCGDGGHLRPPQLRRELRFSNWT